MSRPIEHDAPLSQHVQEMIGRRLEMWATLLPRMIQTYPKNPAYHQTFEIAAIDGAYVVTRVMIDVLTHDEWMARYDAGEVSIHGGEGAEGAAVGGVR